MLIHRLAAPVGEVIAFPLDAVLTAESSRREEWGRAPVLSPSASSLLVVTEIARRLPHAGRADTAGGPPSLRRSQAQHADEAWTPWSTQGRGGYAKVVL